MEQQENNYKPESSEPTERRTIRDIRITRPQQKRETRQVFRENTDDGAVANGRPWIAYALAGAVVCVLLAAALPVVFPKATVVVTPVRVETAATSVVTAYPDDQEGAVRYTVGAWDVIETKSITATTSQVVSDKASGTIRITNANASSQKLIKNTRFESTNNKIYRIRDSIVVPASGTLEVKVFADEGGESFNIATTTFTLPGLKSSPLYTKVTAVTVSEITGGFSGTKKTISTADKKKAAEELEKALVEKVKTGVGHEGTDLLIKKTTSVSLEDVVELAAGDTVTISLTGHAKGLFVSPEHLAYGLSVESGAHIQSKNIAFVGATPLVEAAEQVDPAQLGKKPVRIQVNGTQSLVYTFDRLQLAKDLAGTPRDAVKSLLSKYPEIEKAVATVRPFWKGTLPSNSEKITILLEGEAL